MKANGTYSKTIIAAVLMPVMLSCVQDELFNTSHPDTGKIAVTADWSDRGEDVDIPAGWTVSMGDYTGIETGETHEAEFDFEPGKYTLAAYNTPEISRYPAMSLLLLRFQAIRPEAAHLSAPLPACCWQVLKK